MDNKFIFKEVTQTLLKPYIFAEILWYNRNLATG